MFPPLTLADCLLPDWHTRSLAPRVRALITTRAGGVSMPPYGAVAPNGAPQRGGLNLGLHTGDDPGAVAANRARLISLISTQPAWLEQVHGNRVVAADTALTGPAPVADASVTAQCGVACTVLAADCMPVLFADYHGRAIGAAHAGWRGLAAGVLEATARRVAELAGCAADLHVFLGPAIGARAFEVSDEVRNVFIETAHPGERDATLAAFVPGAAKLNQLDTAAQPKDERRYFADLVALARLRLARVGVSKISGGEWCTVSDPKRFYSYRRDRITGRFAGLIWLAAED